VSLHAHGTRYRLGGGASTLPVMPNEPETSAMKMLQVMMFRVAIALERAESPSLPRRVLQVRST
jgi:hypothetical protein